MSKSGLGRPVSTVFDVKKTVRMTREIEAVMRRIMQAQGQVSESSYIRAAVIEYSEQRLNKIPEEEKKRFSALLAVHLFKERELLKEEMKSDIEKMIGQIKYTRSSKKKLLSGNIQDLERIAIVVRKLEVSEDVSDDAAELIKAWKSMIKTKKGKQILDRMNKDELKEEE